MNGMNKAKELDQWYTKSETVDICISAMREIGLMSEEYRYIEPSCGEGAFIKAMKYKVEGYDIDPKCDGCIKSDWLKTNLLTSMNNTVIFGNPPYGRKAKLAVNFINHSLTMANTVCFIVPITLSTSWTAQKNVSNKAMLMYEETLPEYSFVYNGKEVDVPSVFQIWVNKPDEYRLSKPDTEHPDLEIHIYNKMPTAEKWLDWNWDIAVRRNSNNGEYIVKGETAHTGTHWILIKGPIDTLKKVDWSKVNNNKMTAGMGKADVVKAYTGVLNDN